MQNPTDLNQALLGLAHRIRGLSPEQSKNYRKELMSLNSALNPRERYIPSPKQLQFHMMPAKERAMIGGNRSAKTFGGAMEHLWFATDTHPFRPSRNDPTVNYGVRRPGDPLLGWAVSLDSKMGYMTLRKTILEHLENFFPDLKPGKDWKHHKHPYDFIEFPKTRAELHLMSCDSGWEKFMGAGCDWIGFDEEPPFEIRQQCKKRVMDRKGELFYTFTPEFGLSWSYEQLYLPWKEKKVALNKLDVVQLSMYDNIWLDEEDIKSYEATLSDKEKRVAVYGEYVSFEGQVFDEFDNGIHVVKDFNIPPDWAIYRGIDWGVTNPLACLWVAIAPDGNAYAFDEFYEKGLITQQAAYLIGAKTGERKISMSWGDSAEPDRITEFNLYGLPLSPAPRDVWDGVFRIKAMLGAKPPTLFIMEKCKHFREELLRHSFKRKPRDWSKNTKEAFEDSHNHLVSCGRYIFSSLPRKLGLERIRPLTENELFWKRIQETTERNMSPFVAEDDMFGDLH